MVLLQFTVSVEKTYLNKSNALIALFYYLQEKKQKTTDVFFKTLQLTLHLDVGYSKYSVPEKKT